MRILSMLLVLVMLLSFVACNKTPDPVDGTSGAAETTTAPADTVSPEELALMDNLPNVTFNGDSIDIWLGHTGYNTMFNPDPEAEGDVVSEATTKRNQEIEDRFDVTLNWMPTLAGENMYTRQNNLKTAILAGDEYDLAQHVCSYFAPHITSGCFINQSDNEILDFDKPWWQDFVIDQIRIKDRLYAVSGWFDMNSLGRSSVIFYNMDMAADYHLEDLTQLVRDGKWTYDKMIEIAESVGEDVNNDGKYDDNDIYGLAGRADVWNGQAYTFGYTFTTRHEDGTMTVTGMDDKLLKAFDTVTGIFSANWYQSHNTP